MRRAQFAFSQDSGSPGSHRWNGDLKALLRWCESRPALLDPHCFAQRIAVLDRLEVILDIAESIDEAPKDKALLDRAQLLTSQLEAANTALFAGLRSEIQSGNGHAVLGRWINWINASEDQDPEIKPGLSYDWWDDLVAGILELEEPDSPPDHPGGEMVFYQPTPARHIFEMLRQLNLQPHDVLIDLGSGLGHVPLLAGISTSARCIGIEREPGYVSCARKCAAELRLANVMFIERDVLEADLSSGTVFYLYTPFVGTLAETVLDRLRDEARNRTIRVACFGPCIEMFAVQNWLGNQSPPHPDRVTILSSCNG